jgi:hypothetical protein
MLATCHWNGLRCARGVGRRISMVRNIDCRGMELLIPCDRQCHKLVVEVL